MPFDAYLKLAGVDGESTRKGFEKQIEIYSFSFGAANPVNIGTGSGGAGAGKVSISSFNIMKKTDAASSKLFQNCCSGKHFPTGVVTLNKAGGDAALDYLKYEFKEVFVESIQWSGSTGGDETPSESVSFAFSSVNVTYTPQKDDGSKGSPQVAGWDVKANAKL
jgi:type VI secretion system secreted protein Hcp